MKTKKPKETAVDLAGVQQLTLKRAAIVSGYTVWFLRNLIWSGKLRHQRIGHKIMINQADLLAYIEAVKEAA
jgi:helix-turn-helix protein